MMMVRMVRMMMMIWTILTMMVCYDFMKKRSLLPIKRVRLSYLSKNGQWSLSSIWLINYYRNHNYHFSSENILMISKPTPLLFIVLSKIPEIMAENKTSEYMNFFEDIKSYFSTVTATHHNLVCPHIPALGGVPWTAWSQREDVWEGGGGRTSPSSDQPGTQQHITTMLSIVVTVTCGRTSIEIFTVEREIFVSKV